MTLYYLKTDTYYRIYTDKIELLKDYSKNKNAKIYTKTIRRVKKWTNLRK